jgi:hypothetical protein
MLFDFYDRIIKHDALCEANIQKIVRNVNELVQGCLDVSSNVEPHRINGLLVYRLNHMPMPREILPPITAEQDEDFRERFEEMWYDQKEKEKQSRASRRTRVAPRIEMEEPQPEDQLESESQPHPEGQPQEADIDHEVADRVYAQVLGDSSPDGKENDTPADDVITTGSAGPLNPGRD